jgi:competence protein ComEC
MSKLKIIIPFILIILIILFLSLKSANYLEVYFLDIGQGDAILIRTPDGQNILIDGSADNLLLSQVANNLPWWERTIDYVIISHYHADHMMGLPALLDKYQVKNILVTSHEPDDFLYKVWQEKLVQHNLVPQIVNRGEQFIINNNLSWQILSADNYHEDYNNNSLVIKLSYDDIDFLFTGDLPSEGEEILLAHNFDLDSEILKVAHHGSKYSSSQEFLQAVSPEVCVIQVGEDNKFNHPHPDALHRLDNINCQVKRNDLEGTISIYSDGQTYWLDI